MESIKLRLKLIWANTKFTVQEEFAYSANNWGNMLSTAAYTFSYIAFIEILFNNTKLVAGYGRDEMLFFMLLTQGWFYLAWALIYPNVVSLISSINSGHLDLILTKPMPHLLFLNLRKVKIVSAIRDSLIPIPGLIIVINWSNLSIDFTDLLIGLIIMICGMICTNSMLLLTALPSFWVGESSSLLGLVLQTTQDVGNTFPYEGWPKVFRGIFTFAFPALVTSAISTSVILGKLNPAYGLFSGILAAIIFSAVRVYAWQYSIKHYTSASS